jgi:hypothetical protein
MLFMGSDKRIANEESCLLSAGKWALEQVEEDRKGRSEWRDTKAASTLFA